MVCKRHYLFCLFFVGGAGGRGVYAAVTLQFSFAHDQQQLTTATQQFALVGNCCEILAITRKRDTNGAPARRTTSAI